MLDIPIIPRRPHWWVRLENRVKYLSEGRRGLWGLFAAAFLESSIIPFPIELFLIPAFLTQRRRAFLLATAALAGCVLASVAFYAVGWLLYENLGTAIAQFLGIDARLRQFGEDIGEGGFWLVFSISLLPLPLQVATLGSGMAGFSFLLFLPAIVTSRIVRFHGLALVTLLIGRSTARFFEQRSPLWKAGIFTASIAVVAALSWYVASAF